MQTIIDQITANMIKDEVKEDLQKEFSKFKETAEYKKILKDVIVERIKNDIYNSYDFEEVVNKITTNIIKKELNLPANKKKLINQVMDVFACDSRDYTESILRDKDVWMEVSTYLDDIISTALKYATDEIKNLMKVKK